jgi:hypothetical protein
VGNDQVQTINTTRRTPSANDVAHAMEIFSEYHSQVIPSINIDPLDWWRENASHSKLKKKIIPVIRKYLISPATSVSAKQLFSKAGDPHIENEKQ